MKDEIKKPAAVAVQNTSVSVAARMIREELANTGAPKKAMK
jgi:hypothetical protein